MKSINYSLEEIKKLKKKKITGLNTESSIYIDGNKILKVFEDEYDYQIKKDILRQIEYYKSLLEKELTELVLPKKYLNINNSFAGYIMRFYPGETLNTIIHSNKYSFEQKKEYLIKIGIFLEKMHEFRENSELKNIYINDLQAGNILVLPNGNIKILDTDSININNIGMKYAYYLNQSYESPMHNLSKYNSVYNSIIANEQSDLYCYIMIILETITGKNISFENKEMYKGYIDKINNELYLPDELINIFYNVYEEKENINPKELLVRLKK